MRKKDLLKRIEELEERVAMLEARPVYPIIIERQQPWPTITWQTDTGGQELRSNPPITITGCPYGR